MDATPMDINNHADMHCFGKHVCSILCNDTICSVLPFISEYYNTENVELCSEVTAWKDDEG